MLCFLSLSSLAGGMVKHALCHAEKLQGIENICFLSAPGYRTYLTKMAKKEKGARSQEKGARDSPDFIWATTSVGAILVIALGREMGDSPDFIWATTLDARRSLS